MYCRECGNKIKNNAIICIHCGVSTTIPIPNYDSDQKEWLVTLLLCFFVGYLGIHRFYTGHTAIGIVQLLTLGGCGVWTLIDFIIILVGSYKDSDGRLLKK